jgi:DNA-binding GntR family transcriptional regulator
MTRKRNTRASPRKIRRQRKTGATLSEQAYAELRRLILDDMLHPGEQLLEQELSARLGMSPTPLRIALARLQDEGFIAIKPRHGVRILPLSATDSREIYEVLTSLEATAAYLLAKRALPAGELAPLENALLQMEAAGEHIEAWAGADEQFHAALVALCGNRRLQQTVQLYRDQANRVRKATLRLRLHPSPGQSTRHHRALFEAIKAGDAANARVLHLSHRDGYEAALVKILQSAIF